MNAYKPFDDRPGKCEGCNIPDKPGIGGPSALELNWNSLLKLWLCQNCRHGYSEWMGRAHVSDEAMWAARPGFMRLHDEKQEETIIRGTD